MAVGVPDDEDKRSILEQVIDALVTTNPGTVMGYVDKLREQHPGIDNDTLARKIVSRESLKNGVIGAATGIGGLLTLPVSVPADLWLSWKIHAFIACCIAYVYGYTPANTDLRTDLYLIIAGDAAKEALKRAGIQLVTRVTKQLIETIAAKQVAKKAIILAAERAALQASEKVAVSWLKIVPLMGAPVGFVIDWAFAQAVGRAAIAYYSGKG